MNIKMKQIVKYLLMYTFCIAIFNVFIIFSNAYSVKAEIVEKPNLVKLHQGIEVKQDFITETNFIKSIGVFLCGIDENDKGNLEIQIVDENSNRIFDKKIPLAKIISGEYTKVSIYKKVYQGMNYSIVIKYKTADSIDPPSLLFLSKDEAIRGLGNSSYDGNTLENDVQLNISREFSYFPHKDFFLIYMPVMAAVLLILCKRIITYINCVRNKLSVNEKIIWSIFIITGSLLMLVYIMSASYAFPCSDDFTYADRIGLRNAGILKHIPKALAMTKDFWLKWEGTWYATFIIGVFSPMSGYGMASLQMIMMIVLMMFFLITYCVIYYMFNILHKNVHIMVTTILFTTLLLLLLNAKAYTEIFYIYCVVCIYLIPLSTFFLGIIFLLKAMRGQGKRYYIYSSILMFFMSGGTLMIAGIGCYAILYIVVNDFYIFKKINKGSVLCFITGLMGAVLNVVAPGNYKRHKVTTEKSFDIVHTLTKVFDYFIKDYIYYIKQPIIWLGIAVVLLVGIYYSKQIVKVFCKNNIITFFWGLTTPLVAIFPVCLGYGEDFLFPNRCWFIVDFCIITFILWLSIIIGIYIGNRFQNMLITRTLYVFIVIITIISFNNKSNMQTYITGRGLVNGEIAEYTDNVKEMIRNIEFSNDKIYYITDKPNDLPYYYTLKVTEDKDYWVNESLEMYYKKDCIILKKQKND